MRTTTPMSVAAIKALVAQSVVDALVEHEANRSRNGDDNSDSRGGGERRTVPSARECTYSNFLKCQPLNFKGTEGVFDLTQCALTWWNTHVKTIGYNVAYGMTWKTLMKMLTEKYYPRGEIKKLEIEIWNLKIKGTDIGSVMASKLKTMQEAIEIASDLMDQKVYTFANCQAKNKRNLDDNTRNNQ
ncbi:reverse transcriptase domain-containing protein [Tanacetum coccineum]